MGWDESYVPDLFWPSASSSHWSLLLVQFCPKGSAISTPTLVPIEPSKKPVRTCLINSVGGPVMLSGKSESTINTVYVTFYLASCLSSWIIQNLQYVLYCMMYLPLSLWLPFHQSSYQPIYSTCCLPISFTCLRDAYNRLWICSGWYPSSGPFILLIVSYYLNLHQLYAPHIRF